MQKKKKKGVYKKKKKKKDLAEPKVTQMGKKKILKLSVANPCLFTCTMDSHIIFSSIIEWLTPGRFVFTQALRLANLTPNQS